MISVISAGKGLPSAHRDEASICLTKFGDSSSDIIPLILIVFLTFIIGFYEPLWIPVCILLIGLLYYYNKKSLRSKEVRFNSYLDTVVRNIERTNHHAVQNLDIGMAVFAKDGKLQWKNELFSKYVGTKNLEANVRKMFCAAGQCVRHAEREGRRTPDPDRGPLL